jgi:hypothetical protein
VVERREIPGSVIREHDQALPAVGKTDNLASLAERLRGATVGLTMASSYELIASSMAALGTITIVLALRGWTTARPVPLERDDQGAGPLAPSFADDAALDAEWSGRLRRERQDALQVFVVELQLQADEVVAPGAAQDVVDTAEE